MAVVDPSDDTVTRYIVRRYAYDPFRHERRHQIVAAFDNQPDYHAVLDSLAQGLRARREAGEAVDPREHYTGVVRGAGTDRQRQLARIAKKAIDHGVVPPEQFLKNIEGMAGFTIVRAERDD